MNIEIVPYSHIDGLEFDNIANVYANTLSSTYEYQKRFVSCWVQVVWILAYKDAQFIGGMFVIEKWKLSEFLWTAPFATWNDEEIIRKIVQSYRTYIRKHFFIFNKLALGYGFEFHHILKQELWYTRQVGTSIILLDFDADAYFRSLRKWVKWGVNKAIKEGLYTEVVEQVTQKDLEDVYHLYREMCIRKALQPHSIEDFSALPSTKILIVLKNNEGEIIGGNIIQKFRDFFTLNYNFSKEEYFDSQPNNLLYWNTITYWLKRKYKYFNLWGVYIPSVDGISRFKLSWGWVTEVYNEYSTNPLLFSVLPWIIKFKNKFKN